MLLQCVAHIHGINGTEVVAQSAQLTQNAQMPVTAATTKTKQARGLPKLVGRGRAGLAGTLMAALRAKRPSVAPPPEDLPPFRLELPDTHVRQMGTTTLVITNRHARRTLVTVTVLQGTKGMNSSVNAARGKAATLASVFTLNDGTMHYRTSLPPFGGETVLVRFQPRVKGLFSAVLLVESQMERPSLGAVIDSGAGAGAGAGAGTSAEGNSTMVVGGPQVVVLRAALQGRAGYDQLDVRWG